MVIRMDKDKVVLEDVEVVEKPRKATPKTKKIIAKVNYSKPSKNLTSVSYESNGAICSVFIKGIYTGTVEIEYTGDAFDNSKIIRVK